MRIKLQDYDSNTVIQQDYLEYSLNHICYLMIQYGQKTL